MAIPRPSILKKDNVLAQFFIALSALDFKQCRSLIGMKPKTKTLGQKADVSTSKFAQNCLAEYLNTTLQHATLSNPNVSIESGRPAQTTTQQQAREIAESIRDIFEKFVDYEQDYNLMKFLEQSKPVQRQGMTSNLQN